MRTSERERAPRTASPAVAAGARLVLFGLAAAAIAGGSTGAGGAVVAAAALVGIIASWLEPVPVPPVSVFTAAVAGRLADAAVLAAAAWWFRDAEPRTAGLALAVLSLAFIASYIRTRAQSLGFRVDGPPAEGDGRMLLLGAGLALGWTEAVLWLLAAGSALAVLRRGRAVWRQGPDPAAPKARPPASQPPATGAAPATGRSEPLLLRLEGVAWLAGWRLIRALPEGAAVRLFRWTSLRSWRRNARRREIVRDNLLPVVGPERVDAVVRDAFISYGQYWAETFRMQDMPSEELTRRFATEGLEHIERAHARGRGAVLATLHLGNWDSGGRWVAERWPLAAVVEVLRPRSLFDRFVEHREGLGMTIIPLVKGADVTSQCVEELRRGRLLALVSDRDLSGSGIEVEMFGRTTRLPPGPAVTAIRAGAPVIPACIYQAPNGEWLGSVLPPIYDGEGDADAAELTRRLAASFETLIARDPAQWHCFQRYWTGEA